MNKPSMIQFLFRILHEIKRQKKWVLLPLWILLAAITLVILISGSSHIIPAIYMAI